MLNVTRLKKRTLITVATPLLRFERITILLYMKDHEKIEELSPQLGLFISGRRLPQTVVAGNRIANESEIWLHPDGTLHKYLWTANWSDLEFGCSQRHYVGPVDEDAITLEDLEEQIEIYLADDGDADGDFDE